MWGWAMTDKKAAKSGVVKIRIQYYRSAIGFNSSQKRVVKGLGFGKLNATREVEDTPAVRGMIAKVPHLVRILE
jgi:large subunit ribosomal protein L30